MLNLFSLISPVLNDAPEPWQIGFQDGASPAFEGITELHSSIFFYLVVILIGVVWMMGSIMVNFSSKNASIVYKYANHGTLIELIWTITPALILIAIAFPSFKLLYLMDEVFSPALTIKVVGHQWYILSEEDFMIKSIELEFSTSILASIPMVKRKATPAAKIPRSSCKSIVLHGTTGSTVGIGANNYMRQYTIFTMPVISQLIGHLLGDGTLQFSDNRKSVTPRFIFAQTLKRFDYVWSVFTNLSHYCAQTPYLNCVYRKGVYVPFMQVILRTYPTLLSLHSLFYVKTASGNYVKVVTWELYPYLDEVVLAYWAMDDGSWNVSGFKLATNNFTFQECYILCAMLHMRFGLITTIHNHGGKPLIYIKAESLQLFRSLVLPHFHPTMLYKIQDR